MPVQTEIFRAEVVGSMLRPTELVQARRIMRAGQLPPAEFKAIEDKAVDDALRIQEDAGIDVVTDGEMRRNIFIEFLISAMEGMSMVGGTTVKFHGHSEDAAMEVDVPFSVTGKVSPRICPGVAEFEYARSKTDLPVKVTIPSPLMLPLAFWSKEQSGEAYPNPVDLARDADAAVRGWIAELVDAGCKYISIDSPEMAEAYADRSVLESYANDAGMSPEEFLKLGADMLSDLGNVERPDDVTLGLHLCKGNGTQAWIAEGGYDALAEAAFPRLGGYDTVHFEYDDERSGGFEPLAALPDTVVAVLGLVSTKWTKMEDPAELRARIAAAAEFHPLDRLALAPQCGFASAAETADQRKVTAQTQADKLKLVADVARSVWG